MPSPCYSITMADELNALKYPKLTNLNWKPWSALVRCHLESKELLDMIEIKPEGDQMKAWKKKDA